MGKYSANAGKYTANMGKFSAAIGRPKHRTIQVNPRQFEYITTTGKYAVNIGMIIHCKYM